MPPSRDTPSQSAIAALSLAQGHAVLTHARALQQAAGSGPTQPLLRGKNLGLLCETEDDPDAAFLRVTAVALGAKVAHLRPSLLKLSTARDIQQTAHVLGLLYDAVACQGMAPVLVQRLAYDAWVPVHDGIASPAHPTARLAEQVGGDTSPADKRRFVLQALLLSIMT